MKKNSRKIIHMLGMPNTICNDTYDHCPFTTKVRNFPSIIQKKGWKVIEYSNGESLSEAYKHIQILTKKELLEFLGEPDSLEKLTSGSNTLVTNEFYKRLVKNLKDHVESGDIIAHPYGPIFSDLIRLFPECFHIETGVGYLNQEFGAKRIYESYSWMHYNHGFYRHCDAAGSPIIENGREKIGRWGHAYEWVIPNAFDTNKWEVNYENTGYLLYVGRIIPEKGIQVVKDLSEYFKESIKIVGLGKTELFQGDYMDFVGGIYGHKNKNNLFKNARAVIMPTQYNEPLGFVAIEAMLSGTPVITTDFGSFPEIIEHGKTGFRCHTFGDFIAAVKKAPELDRKYIADKAHNEYRLERAAVQYDNAFKQLLDLTDKGWYTEKSYYIK